jgi:DNA-binding NtrC family response regulator
VTTTRRADEILIVEPDKRVRCAIADLIESTEGLTVLAACATFEEVARIDAAPQAQAALVSVRHRDCDAAFAAVTILARELPVIVVASVGSAAERAIAAGAAAFYDEDGDADALVAMVRDVVRRAGSG